MEMSQVIYSTVKFIKNTGSKADEKGDGRVEDSKMTADVSISDNFVEPKLEDKSTADQQEIPSVNVGSGKSKLVIAAAVSLGLLSLLLAAVILLVVQFSEDRRNWNMERAQLEVYKSQLIQLETLNYNLSQNVRKLEAEKENLDVINGNLTQEKNKLQSELSKIICDYGEHFAGSCYLNSAYMKKNWYDSKADCEKLGGHLVIISDEAEQKFISKLEDELWIGLTDEETGAWQWVNGDGLTTSYWADNQPDNDYEHCATVFKSKPPLQSWNDFECIRDSKWICEKVKE